MIIHSRRIELQSFTDRICRHPVLAGSEVQTIFLYFQINILSIFIQCWFKASDCPCPGVETFCVRDGRQEVDKGGQRSFFSSWFCREICVTLFMNSYSCFKTRILTDILQGKRSAESDPLVGTVFLTTVQVLPNTFFFLGKSFCNWGWQFFSVFFRLQASLSTQNLQLMKILEGFPRRYKLDEKYIHQKSFQYIAVGKTGVCSEDNAQCCKWPGCQV